MLSTEDGAAFKIEDCQLSVIFGSNVSEFTVFWWGNLRERDHLGDPDVDGRIILRWIFRLCLIVMSVSLQCFGGGT